MDLYIGKISNGIYHFTESQTPSSMLSRYGIINHPETKIQSDEFASVDSDKISFSACKRPVNLSLKRYKKDYTIDIPLSEGERLFGGGDSNRENIMIRGSRLVMYIANVRSYGPMPIIMSSDGWAIVLGVFEARSPLS